MAIGPWHSDMKSHERYSLPSTLQNGSSPYGTMFSHDMSQIRPKAYTIFFFFPVKKVATLSIKQTNLIWRSMQLVNCAAPCPNVKDSKKEW